VHTVKDYGANSFGGMLSSRKKIEVKINGEKKTGFFTERKIFDPQKEESEALEKFICSNPKYSDVFMPILARDDARIMKQVLMKVGHHVAVSGQDNLFLPKFWESQPKTDNERKEIEDFNKLPQNFRNLLSENADNNEFLSAFNNFYDTVLKTNNSIAINDFDLGMKTGDVVDSRNSAMTAVDKFLGFNVLANSYKMRLIDGDKIVEGTFMEEAEGTNFVGLKGDDARLHSGVETGDDIQIKKDLTNLQILDYICGNVDRHAGNMFYKFDNGNPSKLIGIQGIDNDASFSTLVSGYNKGKLNLASFNSFGVIDRKTADKVSALTESTLKAILSPYGLDGKAVEAAWDRTQLLQQALERNADRKFNKDAISTPPDPKNMNSEITILDDEDWKEISLGDIALRGKNATCLATKNIWDRKNGYKRSISRFDVIAPKKSAEFEVNEYGRNLKSFGKMLVDAKELAHMNSKIYKDLISLIDRFDPKQVHTYFDGDDGLDGAKNALHVYDNITNAVRNKAQEYINHKQKQIDAGTLDVPSTRKVRAVKYLINFIDNTQKRLEDKLSLYEKNSATFDKESEEKDLFWDVYSGKKESQVYVDGQNEEKESKGLSSQEEREIEIKNLIKQDMNEEIGERNNYTVDDNSRSVSFNKGM
ncbi:MAG: hypothetical protein MJ072_01700, partial [Clostridia bacterium]|nr:hypothetical protein [Clostridia bacterium]